MTVVEQLSVEVQVEYRVHISESSDDPAWDEFVACAPGGHHVQTSLWSQIRAVQGWKVLRIIVTREEDIVGGVQLLTRSMPLIGAAAYVTKGPLCAPDDQALLNLVLDELKQACRAHHIRYLIVQPPNNGQHIVAHLTQRGFRPMAIGATSEATTLIDLSKSLDEILAQMHSKNRRNIRRSEREGITVREGSTEADLDIFYDLHLATSKRRQFVPFPRTYFAQMWKVMRPYEYITLMFSEYRGGAVSAVLLVPFGDTVIAKVNGWSGQHDRCRPNEAVFWGAIRWAKEHGFRYFDLDGIDPAAAHAVLNNQPIAEDSRYSPTFFKLMFGGQVTLFPPSYDYVLNPVLRWAYRAASPLLRGDSILLWVAAQLRKRPVDGE